MIAYVRRERWRANLYAQATVRELARAFRGNLPTAPASQPVEPVQPVQRPDIFTIMGATIKDGRQK